MRETKDKYYDPIVFHNPNATVYVYRPILTEEERERRMKELYRATEAILIELEIAKRIEKLKENK